MIGMMKTDLEIESFETRGIARTCSAAVTTFGR